MRLLLLLSLILLILTLQGGASLTELSRRDANGTHQVFRVGVVLDMDSLAGRIGLSCLSMALSDFYSFHTNFTTRLVFYIKDSKGNVIDAAASALHLLRDLRVDAIIGPQKSAEATFLMKLGDRSRTPIISFSATSPSLHHRTPYFIQTAQTDENQVGAIAAIIKNFHWKQVVLIYEDTDYGNGVIPYLANALQEINVQIPYSSIIPLSASDNLLGKELYKLMTMQTRVFVVHMSHSLARRLFLKAKEQGMMTKGYAWIITSGIADLLYMMDSHVVEAMQGVLGVRPLIPKTRNIDLFASRWKREFLQMNPKIRQAELGIFGLWAYDTLWAIALAAETVGSKGSFAINDGMSTNQTDLFHLPISETGPKLLKAVSKTMFDGYSGEFHLVDGHLKQSSFQILNVVGKGEREVGIWRPHLGVPHNMYISKNRFGSIIWPGESTNVPKGWEIPSSGEKLKIGVYGNEGIAELVNVERDPQTNATKVSGYIPDIFDSVVKKLPYGLEYEYVPFGDGSSGENYNDLVFQVSLQNFDAMVGDTIVTVNRSKYVDFTLPFEEGGIVLIAPIKSEDMNNRWTFLKPLDGDLWLATIAFFIFTGIVFWLIEHRVNPEFRGSPPQHLGLILWFPLLTLVFAQRERIVSNFAKLVEVMWVFVVLILSSTYTASLSSRLTVQRLQPTITKLEDLIKNNHYVGYKEGSFVVDYLKKMGFEASKLKPYKSLDDFDKGLSKGSQNGGISAFFVATLHSKLFLSKHCNKYMKIGPTYPTNGVAFVFQKGSPLVADVSRAIIDLTESDNILEIKRKYIGNKKCLGPDSTATPNSVTLQSFGALFIIYGCVATMCLLAYMIKYVYKNKLELQRILNSNTTPWSKICEICRHYDQKDSSVRPLRRSPSK